MSWVKLKNTNGKISKVPQSWYDTVFKFQSQFELVIEQKSEQKENKVKENVVDGQEVQQSKKVKRNTIVEDSNEIKS